MVGEWSSGGGGGALVGGCPPGGWVSPQTATTVVLREMGVVGNGWMTINLAALAPAFNLFVQMILYINDDLGGNIAIGLGILSVALIG